MGTLVCKSASSVSTTSESTAKPTIRNANVNADLIIQTLIQELPTRALAWDKRTPMRVLPCLTAIVWIWPVYPGDLASLLSFETRIFDNCSVVVTRRDGYPVQCGDNMAEYTIHNEVVS
jgi:hypothetical protein